jgi:hypothetical protein
VVYLRLSLIALRNRAGKQKAGVLCLRLFLLTDSQGFFSTVLGSISFWFSVDGLVWDTTRIIIIRMCLQNCINVGDVGDRMARDVGNCMVRDVGDMGS